MTDQTVVDRTRWGVIRSAVALGLIVAGSVALSCSSKDPLLQSRDSGSNAWLSPRRLGTGRVAVM